MSKLTLLTMYDGPRQFAEMPATISFSKRRKSLKAVDSIQETDFISDWWIDFDYYGYQFSVNDYFGKKYRLLVKNPNCADEILLEVIAHFQNLLQK